VKNGGFVAAPYLDMSRCFADVFLLQTGMEDLEEDILYVADIDTLSDYLKLYPQQEKRLCVVCLAESPADLEEFSERVRWIFAPWETGVISVFNMLRGLFYRLHAWDRKLDQIILTGQDMNAMLDAYAEIMPHHLLIWDASFNVCAYTKHVPAPGENVAQIEEKGHFFRETVEELMRKGLIAKQTDAGTRFISGKLLPSGQDALIHHYFRQGLRFYSVCVYSEENLLEDQGLLDLTEYFFKRLNLYLDKNAPVFKEHRFIYESFLVSILDGRLTDPKAIEEKAEIFRIDCHAEYRLYCIQFMEYRPTVARYLMETMPNTAPNVKFFQHNSMILMLKPMRPEENGMRMEEEWKERVTRLLVPNKAFCGISACFCHLKDLPTAYEQACAALQFGLLFRRNDRRRLYCYKDYYLYHLLQGAQETVKAETLYLKKFDLLMEDDLRKNTNNVQLLSVYLENNQAVTATAKQMYMHRNSVIYRIHRIEEMLGIDLGAHRDVFQVNFSLRVLRYLAWTSKEYKKYRELFP